jgi:hypothetical protein
MADTIVVTMFSLAPEPWRYVLFALCMTGALFGTCLGIAPFHFRLLKMMA